MFYFVVSVQENIPWIYDIARGNDNHSLTYKAEALTRKSKILSVERYESPYSQTLFDVIDKTHNDGIL